MSLEKGQRRLLLPLLSIVIILSALTGCSQSDSADEHLYDMAPLEGMPEEIQVAPLTVQQAYQFAVANPEILEEIPCYCGCGSMGHASNYACYVAEVDESGGITYDSHALGCSICVDITLDTMRLLEQGKSTVEIRTFIDQTYSQYGPSNIP